MSVLRGRRPARGNLYKQNGTIDAFEPHVIAIAPPPFSPLLVSSSISTLFWFFRSLFLFLPGRVSCSRTFHSLFLSLFNSHFCCCTLTNRCLSIYSAVVMERQTNIGACGWPMIIIHAHFMHACICWHMFTIRESVKIWIDRLIDKKQREKDWLPA